MRVIYWSFIITIDVVDPWQRTVSLDAIFHRNRFNLTHSSARQETFSNRERTVGSSVEANLEIPYNNIIIIRNFKIFEKTQQIIL